MIRHQIYLTPQLKREIEIQARRRGKSESGVIREVLENGLKVKTIQKKSTALFLKNITGIGKKGPKDLSTNMFDYLYGDKSPNYGKAKKAASRR